MGASTLPPLRRCRTEGGQAESRATPGRIPRLGRPVVGHGPERLRLLLPLEGEGRGEGAFLLLPLPLGGEGRGEGTCLLLPPDTRLEQPRRQIRPRRDRQHPAKRPKNAPDLWCRDKQGRHLRLHQQMPNLPADTSGMIRHQSDQPGEACRQTRTPKARRSKAAKARGKRSSTGSHRCAPGLDPSYQGLKPFGHTVQVGPQQHHDRARRQLPASMLGNDVAQ